NMSCAAVASAGPRTRPHRTSRRAAFLFAHAARSGEVLDEVRAVCRPLRDSRAPLVTFGYPGNAYPIAKTQDAPQRSIRWLRRFLSWRDRLGGHGLGGADLDDAAGLAHEDPGQRGELDAEPVPDHGAVEREDRVVAGAVQLGRG